MIKDFFTIMKSSSDETIKISVHVGEILSVSYNIPVRCYLHVF